MGCSCCKDNATPDPEEVFDPVATINKIREEQLRNENPKFYSDPRLRDDLTFEERSKLYLDQRKQDDEEIKRNLDNQHDLLTSGQGHKIPVVAAFDQQQFGADCQFTGAPSKF